MCAKEIKVLVVELELIRIYAFCETWVEIHHLPRAVTLMVVLCL